MKKIYFFVIVLLFNLMAQNQKMKISGIVTDEKAAPLAFANIYLDGRLEGATSDSDGYFFFDVPKPGNYTLVCSYLGYKEYRKEIRVQAGQPLTLNIVLAEKPIQSKGVTVTASAFTSGEEEGVTLTPLEVVSTPGAAADVFWAIKTYPGVQQVDEGAGLFVRGGDVSETAVILDGAYLNHPYRYESPNGGYFGTISPFLLKGTYFSSGGYAAEYGNALSGALIMESRDLPLRNQFTIGSGLAAISGAASIVLKPNKFGVSFSGNYSNTQPMFELNNNRHNFSRYPAAYDLNANTLYRYSPKGSFKLFLFREVDEVGTEVKNPTYGGYYEGDSKNNLVNLHWKHLTTSNLLLKGNLAFSRFQKEQNLVVLNLNNDERFYQMRFSGEYQAKDNLKIQSGVEAFDNRIYMQGKVPQEYLDFNPDAPFDRIDLDYSSRRSAAFIQAEWFASPRLRFNPGIRAEYESISEDAVVDPRISLAYEMYDSWNITLAAGRYHQFPEPFYYDPYAGNPDLKSLSAWHYIAGISYQKENTIYRIEGYYKDYRHLLLENNKLNYTNNGSGHAYGFDLFVKHTFGPAKGWVSYSYLHARRHWMDTPGLASPDFDITHNLITVLEMSLSLHINVGCAYRYATGKPYSTADNRYNNARVPAYQKLDFNLTYLYRFFEGNLTVFYLAVSNLLGRDNIFDYYYSPDYRKREAIKSSMLRSVYFGVSFTF